MERSYLEMLAHESSQRTSSLRKSIVDYIFYNGMNASNIGSWYLSDIADMLESLNIRRTSRNAELLIKTIEKL